MKAIGLQVTLEEPCILSAHGGTTGLHQTLTHIPGAALLGAAARCYEELSAKDQALVFHSGAVRFGVCLPWIDGEWAAPIPLTWRHAKGAPPSQDGWFVGGAVQGLDGTFEGDRLPEAVKGGYVTTSGRRVRPGKVLHVKSARDPKTRRALDEALFSYEALAAGQTFRGVVSWEGEADAAVEAVVERLVAGPTRLGASRSAQFGTVTVERVEAPRLDHDESRSDRLRLWVLSDLALEDAHGLPTLTPNPELFGLNGATWLPEESALRTRSYAPFHGKRLQPCLERHVIEAGSVLSFKLEGTLSPDERERLGSERFGLHRQDGLGQVWPNAAHVVLDTPRFEAPRARAGAAKVALPGGALAGWAAACVRARGEREEGVSSGKSLSAVVEAAWRQLGAEAFPGPSQWNQLAGLADQGLDDAEFAEGFRKLAAHGVSGQTWGNPVWWNRQEFELRALILRRLEGLPPRGRDAAVRFVCGDMARRLHAQGEVSA